MEKSGGWVAECMLYVLHITVNKEERPFFTLTPSPLMCCLKISFLPDSKKINKKGYIQVSRLWYRTIPLKECLKKI
jgi:hypothetical protein